MLIVATGYCERSEARLAARQAICWSLAGGWNGLLRFASLRHR